MVPSQCASGTTGATGATGATILVVCGDSGACDAYCSLLRVGGWRVRGATDVGQAIVAVAGQARPHLVLLCGWAAVDSFLEAAPHVLGAADIVVVAHCSAAAAPEAIGELLDRGVDVVIPQPCSTPVLVRRLRAALRWTRIG